MNTVAKPGKPAEEGQARPAEETPAGGVEGEIREFVRRDIPPRRLPPVDGESGAGNLNALIERVAGPSIREIDSLIRELQTVRDYLKTEGDRVQREVANFTQISQAAMASAKVILDSMGQWKGATGPARPDRG